MDNNKNWKVRGFITEIKRTVLYKTIDVIKETPMGYLSTQCLKCKNICHENCSLEEIKTDGSVDFKKCNAFNGQENCLKCSCHYSAHHHSKIKKETV